MWYLNMPHTSNSQEWSVSCELSVDDFSMYLQFAVLLNDKKAKIRHLKAECMQVFMIYAFLFCHKVTGTMNASGDVFQVFS